MKKENSTNKSRNDGSGQPIIEEHTSPADVEENIGNDLFSNDSSRMLYQSEIFYHSALRLEEISNAGGVKYNQIVDAKKLIPGKLYPKTSSAEQTMAMKDYNFCLHSCIFLFAQSLELLLKAVAIAVKIENPFTHDVRRLYKEIKSRLGLSEFNGADELLEKIYHTISWAGRYPAPKRDINKNTQSMYKKIKGIKFPTNSLPIALEIEHLKEFRSYLLSQKALKHTSQLLASFF